jgi:hypothetical protein
VTERRTYALLIYDATGGEPIDAAENRRVLNGHRAVQRAAEAADALHAVARLDAPGATTTRTVRKRGDEHLVTDGPFIESKEWLVGFYLVDCVDEAEAVAHAKRICPTGAHAIEVRLVTWHRP